MFVENAKQVKQESLDAKDYFEQYWRYCSSLRNWFVAFGVGGCVLFLSKKAEIFNDLSPATKATVIIAFIIGVVVQILLGGLNKYIHWCIYWGKEDEGFHKKWYYKSSNRISTWIVIDFVIDIITFVSFCVAAIPIIIAMLTNSK